MAVKWNMSSSLSPLEKWGILPHLTIVIRSTNNLTKHGSHLQINAQNCREQATKKGFLLVSKISWIRENIFYVWIKLKSKQWSVVCRRKCCEHLYTWWEQLFSIWNCREQTIRCHIILPSGNQSQSLVLDSWLVILLFFFFF